MSKFFGKAEADSQTPQATFTHIKCLIVEDNKTLQLTLKRLLTRLGLNPDNIHQALDGFQALSALYPDVQLEVDSQDEEATDKALVKALAGCKPAESFDIIFLDNQMPVMMGERFAKIVWQLGLELPIVHTTTGEFTDTLKLVSKHIICKAPSFNRNEIAEMIQTVCFSKQEISSAPQKKYGLQRRYNSLEKFLKPTDKQEDLTPQRSVSLDFAGSSRALL